MNTHTNDIFRMKSSLFKKYVSIYIYIFKFLLLYGYIFFLSFVEKRNEYLIFFSFKKFSYFNEVYNKNTSTIF